MRCMRMAPGRRFDLELDPGEDLIQALFKQIAGIAPLHGMGLPVLHHLVQILEHLIVHCISSNLS